MSGKIQVVLEDPDVEKIGHVGPINKVIEVKDEYWTCGRDATLQCWKPETNDSFSLKHIAEGHTDWIQDLCYAEASDELITCSQDHTVRIWGRKDKLLKATLQGHCDYVESISYNSECSDLLISAGLQGDLLSWDLEEGCSRDRFLEKNNAKPPCSFYCSDIDPFSNLVVAGGTDCVVRLWDMKKPDSVVKTLTGHSDLVVEIFVQDFHCISVSVDGTVRLWDLRSMHLVAKYRLPNGKKQPRVSNTCASRDAAFTRIFVGGQIQKISSEDPPTGFISEINLVTGSVKFLLELPAPVHSITLDESRNKIFFSTAFMTSVFSISNPKKFLFEFPSTPYVTACKALNDTMSILLEKSDGKIELWDLNSFDKIKEWESRDIEELADDLFIEKKVPTWASLGKGIGRCTVAVEESNGLKGITVVDDIEANLGQRLLRKIFQGYRVQEKHKEKKRLAEEEARMEELRRQRAEEKKAAEGDDEVAEEDTKDEKKLDEKSDEPEKREVAKQVEVEKKKDTAAANDELEEEEPLKKNVKVFVYPEKGGSYVHYSKDTAMLLPQWVHKAVLVDADLVRGNPKLPFRLSPHPGSTLPPLPQGSSLNGPGHFCVRKVLEYVVAQMGHAGHEGLSITDVQLVARGARLPAHFDLRTLNEYWFMFPENSQIPEIQKQKTHRGLAITYLLTTEDPTTTFEEQED